MPVEYKFSISDGWFYAANRLIVKPPLNYYELAYLSDYELLALTKEKWLPIVRRLEKETDNEELIADGSSETCPLCICYNSAINITDHNCYDCPVGNHTGKTGCADTPYMDWLQAEYVDEQLPAAKKIVFLIETLMENEK